VQPTNETAVVNADNTVTYTPSPNFNGLDVFSYQLQDLDGGLWADTNCDLDTFVTGRLCEYEPNPCGDSVIQSSAGEQCDDGNRTDGDGCPSTCQDESL
jgi:cysteine-rich repeat protein